MLRDGTLDLLRRDQLVTVMTSGELLGYSSLLTRTAPAFTVRARSDCALYCIPGDLGVELLSREDGVRWLATTQRDALLYAARSLSPLPEVQTLPVTAVIRGAPQFCDSETTIGEAAEAMTAQGRSAILVRTREGLGIVTDTDLREKAVAGGVSRDAPVSAIMSTPVRSVAAGAFTPEASLTMLTYGVSHLPVIADDGAVVGIVSAGDLMSLEARSPFALRRSLQWARDEDELVAAASDVPRLFVDLLDARLDAPLVCRVLTILHDTLTARLLELAFERHGAPPVDYAWLVFGSAARNELTLASDQDSGLAYADTDDPAVDEYFRGVAEDVTAGLTRCGFEPDSHYVMASIETWRMTLSGWKGVFSDSLESKDIVSRARAAVCFDYRQSAGRLYVEQALTDIMREVPEHPEFLQWLARTGSGFRPQVSGLRHKLYHMVDIKKGALLPIQNLARYHALRARHHHPGDPGAPGRGLRGRRRGSECDRTLREAYLTHQAAAAGAPRRGGARGAQARQRRRHGRAAAPRPRQPAGGAPRGRRGAVSLLPAPPLIRRRPTTCSASAVRGSLVGRRRVRIRCEAGLDGQQPVTPVELHPDGLARLVAGEDLVVVLLRAHWLTVDGDDDVAAGEILHRAEQRNIDDRDAIPAADSRPRGGSSGVHDLDEIAVGDREPERLGALGGPVDRSADTSSHVLRPPWIWPIESTTVPSWLTAWAELATELEWSPVESLKHSQGVGPTQPITFPPVSISGAPRPEVSRLWFVRRAVTFFDWPVHTSRQTAVRFIVVLVSCVPSSHQRCSVTTGSPTRAVLASPSGIGVRWALRGSTAMRAQS